MAVVDATSVDVPLSLFSSLDTELSPSDIPEGISPDNQDIVYLPGSVATRPALQRVFGTPVEVLGTPVYEKSFVTPSGVIKNLYGFNDGNLWVEDVTNAPGVATLLFASAGASAFSSVTAGGWEFIAQSDGQHGVDIPLQYDGTNLWRVTQDGPGAPPTVQSIALPSSTLAASGSGAPQAISTALSTSRQGNAHLFFYATATYTTVAAHGFFVGAVVTVTGCSNAFFNVTNATIISVPSSTTFVISLTSSTLQNGNGGNATQAINPLTRNANTVTGITATSHGLQVGYQVQIQGAGTSQIGGGITSILLNNEDNPGVATVTTPAAHGLLPNNEISITGVPATAVGGNTSATNDGSVTTLTATTAHGLAPGAVIKVSGFTGNDQVFNGTFIVSATPSSTTLVYSQPLNETVATVAGSTTTTVPVIVSSTTVGAVALTWPIPDTPTPTFFTVLTAPTATTFTIAITYTDGTWTGGAIAFNWDGIFYVTGIPSSTTFQYQQYGPNAIGTVQGTATPYGQATPGIHQVAQAFLFENGTISAPSPPATFVASGGQYLSLANLATGPNVKARIVLFTGAGGSQWYYIPVPAQVNGLVVSTATQINDNSTTAATLDFADNTLYAALGASIPGNNLPALNILGPSAGFFTYASRLLAWGNRNKVNGFLNLGFGGGASGIYPLGWTGYDAYGSLQAKRLGDVWQIAVQPGAAPCGKLSQSAYADSVGDPILEAGTAYSLRLWLNISLASPSVTFTATLSSASTAFTSTATFGGANMTTAAGGSFLSAAFSAVLPATLPSDLTLTISAASTLGAVITLNVGDLEFFPTQQPYNQFESWISYATDAGGSLGQFDGNTGILGPEDDLSPIMNFGTIRDQLYIVTGSGLHETADNGQTEPSNWGVRRTADNCGAWSIAAVARNPQGIGCAGKEWMAWSGPDGAQIFTGSNPGKVSQEIQSIWDSIDQTKAYLAWTKNDQTAKRCYFGIPLVSTGAMQTLVLDYRNLDGEGIVSSPPIHISFTGKMIASDLTRKWTRWNVNAYCGELIYRSGNSQPVMSFGCFGATGGGNIYTLNPAKYTDDDFGRIFAYYTTYFFVSHEMEQMLQLGSHRKAYQYLTAFVQAIGTVNFTPYVNALWNGQVATPNLAGSLTPNIDLEIGLNVIGSRVAFKIAATPLTGQTDSYFNLQKLIINMKKAPWQPVAGSAQGSY